MKKIILTLFCLLGLSTNAFAIENIEFIKTFSEKNNAQNKVWIGTFQLVWNDFMNEILKAPVKFVSGSQKTAKQLNKQEFNQNMLSEDSYYKTYDKTSLELKGEIENAIMEKFGEKSDILDKIDWNKPNGAYFLYVMLKKDFDFLQKFNQLASGNFGSKGLEAKYFGISETSKNQLYKNVKVLFFNNTEDFAVALRTQSNDIVMMYRTDKNKSFNALYKEMNKKATKYNGNNNFTTGDKIKIPYISFKHDINFDDLCGREIKGKERLYFEKALQTIDFEMNEQGVKLKSEAALDVSLMSFLPPKIEKGREMFFDDTFVIFLKETDKQKPYFAARINDLELFNNK